MSIPTPSRTNTTKVAATPRVSHCIIGRCGITSNNLVRTNKKLVEADGRQINLDGAIFLNLTLGATTTSQLVDVTPQVTRLFLPKNACQDLRVTPLDLPAQTTMTSRVAK